jgi:superfamily II DNA or RNA helicase
MSINTIKDQLRIKPTLLPRNERPRVAVSVPITNASAVEGHSIALQTSGAIELIEIDRVELMEKLRHAGIVRVFQESDLVDRSRVAVAESVAWPSDAPKKKTIKIKVKAVSRLESDDAAKDGEIEERTTDRPPKGSFRSKRQPWEDLEKAARTFIPPTKMDTHHMRAPDYYMNNRSKFSNFINSYFSEYRDEVVNEAVALTCEDMDGAKSEGSEFKLLIHQKIVRDYLNLHTPYRGLLLYHGLGSGKTCSSIAIAEGMQSTKRIIVMTPASLQRNYIEEIKKCGDVLFKREQHWTWTPLNKSRSDEVEAGAAAIGVSNSYIKSRKGVWLVDTTKASNIDTLTPKQMMLLDEQIDNMIHTKYRFINYNGLTREHMRAISNDFETNIFSHSVVVIDEVHNFISRIANKLKKEKNVTHDTDGKLEAHPIALSLILYEMLLSARDVRIVMLTGTPMINYPNELGILFNILRGYIKTWDFQLKPEHGYKTTSEKIATLFSKEKHMDYFEYAKNEVLTVTRNPFGFIKGQTTSVHPDTDRPPLTDIEFRDRVLNTLEQGSIPVNRSKTTVKLFKSFPDDLDTFKQMFLGENDQVKNPDLFKKRILGLTSYFRSAQEGLLPRYDPLTDFIVVKIPMSDYQLGLYESVRSAERKEESRKKKNKPAQNKDPNGLFDEPSSTYRIFSRLFCNFVMPLPPGRPLPSDNSIDDSYTKTLGEGNKKGTNELQGNAGDEVEGDEIMEKGADATYPQRIVGALRHLTENGKDIFSSEGLQKYSPKFLHMYDNVVDPEHAGLHLVYSQFRTLEGIGLFKLMLDYKGFTQFKIKKGLDGVWALNIADADRGKPTYALYTGTESAEEKEMVRNIYNSDWNPNLPITQTLRDIANNNHLGEIIKVLMITASGSEGINLRSTRFVHIMEPYWHPTRKDQIIGRARRICSHKALPVEMQDVRVFMYLMTITDEQLQTIATKDMKLRDKSKNKDQVHPDKPDMDFRVVTSDEALFEISTLKEGIITGLTRLIKEASIDCATYTKRGNAEQVQCVQYGEPRDTEVSYVPNIVNQPPDDIQRQNREKIKWKGEEYSDDTGRTYIRRQMDKNTANLYDVESYRQALEGTIAEPRLMAIEEKRGDDYVIRRVA